MWEDLGVHMYAPTHEYTRVDTRAGMRAGGRVGRCGEICIDMSADICGRHVRDADGRHLAGR